MRLYLSSFRLGNHAHRIGGLVGSHKPRILAVMNALDCLPASKRDSLLQRLMADFAAVGATVSELDLRDYFSGARHLDSALADCDMLWANGGNAFTLLAAMKQSGLIPALRGLLDEDRIAYGGYSAGAVVATPTLRGIELVDSAAPADALPSGYASEIPWDGMGLVPYSIAPHFRSPHAESAAMDAVIRYFEVQNMPYRALRDGEVIIVDGAVDTWFPFDGSAPGSGSERGRGGPSVGGAV